MTSTQPRSRLLILAAVFLLVLSLGLGVACAIAWSNERVANELVQDLEDNVDDLEDELRDAERQLGGTNTQIEGQQLERERFEQALEQANLEIFQARHQHVETLQELDAARRHLAGLESELHNQQLAYELLERRYAHESEQFRDTLAQRQALVESLVVRLDEANAGRAQLEASRLQARGQERHQHAATVEGLAEALEVATRVNQSKDAQLQRLNAQVQEMTARLGDLSTQNADLQQALIQMRAQNRRLENEVRRLNEHLRQGLEQQQQAQDCSVPATVVTGEIAAVEQIGDGIVIVMINLGSRDQVRVGMQFTVSRDDQYVGAVQITHVDVAECVGRVSLGQGVHVGDHVRAGRGAQADE